MFSFLQLLFIRFKPFFYAIGVIALVAILGVFWWVGFSRPQQSFQDISGLGRSNSSASDQSSLDNPNQSLTGFEGQEIDENLPSLSDLEEAGLADKLPTITTENLSQFEIAKFKDGRNLLKVPLEQQGQEIFAPAIQSPMLARVDPNSTIFGTLFIRNNQEIKFIGDDVENLFEFEKDGQIYWFSILVMQDGGRVLQVSRPDFASVKQLEKFKYEFVINTKKTDQNGIFEITVAEGNGDAPERIYKIEPGKALQDSSAEIVIN